MSAFDNATLMITGGTGSFGSTVLKHFLDSDLKEIRIFSRDEKKQDDMRHALQANHPENAKKVKFYIGDVRSPQSIRDAEDLGWDNRKGNLDKVAPGCSIGGNRFGNYEGLLPEAKGRKYTECDINYDGGYRNGERIVFSNDGLIFYTSDHYQTFTPVKVIVEETEKAGEGKKK